MDLNRTCVELLAPVGRFDVLEAVVAAGANAVYLGGKKHNMRLFRSDYNFSEQQLGEAVAYAHAHDVKAYITVNNLQSDAELPALTHYLETLGQIGPDALIVQDLGVLSLIRRSGLRLTAHTSVMANTHNAEGLLALMELGVTRVVLGREVTLAEAARLREETGMELEYFIHGDMCVAQSGQCFASGLLFGESSNRGRCMKPCRWKYSLIDVATGLPIGPEEGAGVTPVPGPYLLAQKDMCMLGSLPELIQSGIYSFKIEGRMRSAEFLADVVGVYRRAIDRYLADPAGYRVDEADLRALHAERVRDFSTNFAFGNPGRQAIGYTGEREPKFFSTSCREFQLTGPEPQERLARPVSDPATVAQAAAHGTPRLSVRVASLTAVEPVIAAGADLVYVGGEQFVGAAPAWNMQTLRAAVALGEDHGVPVVVATPRITKRRELNELAVLFSKLDAAVKPAGVLASNLGVLRLARRLTKVAVYADFSLNVMNREAAKLLAELGAVQVTAQLESSLPQIAALVDNAPLPVEVVAHGALPGMILDHCLPAAVCGGLSAEDACPGYCRDHELALLDPHDQRRPVRVDQYCRNHVFLANDLCTLPYLGRLVEAGAAGLRIDGQLYNETELAAIVALYRRNLDRASADLSAYCLSPEDWQALVAVSPRPLGIGAYGHTHDESGA